MNPGRVGSATRPGQRPEWLFVVGRSFVAAVPHSTNPSVMSRLAALAAMQQADLESVVSVLPLGGEAAVESFVVIVPENRSAGELHADGIAVSVVIRGEIAADVYSVGGSRRFTDRGIRPWLLADFRSVVGVVVGSPRYTAVEPGGIRGGSLVSLGTAAGDSLFWSPNSTDAETDQQPNPVDAGIDDTILRPTAPIDDTILRTGVPVEDTIIRPPIVAPVERSTEPVEPLPPEPEPVEPVPAEGPRYGFRVSGGDERRLDAVYYLGRRPVAPRIVTESPPLLIKVESRTSAVSATHVEIRQVGDTVVVTDLGSTNGTLVRWPRGKKERLRGGQSLTVLPGTTVDLGDGNIIEILPVSGR